MRTQTFLILLFALTLILPLTGCGEKKKEIKKDYGKPTWLVVDESKFARLSEAATELEGGTITVYDPEGWERQPRGAAKPPKGFESVIVFKKGNATILMTKSQDAKELPDLDEENIEEFADSVQQKFRSTVNIVKIGNKVGVYLPSRIADRQRLSKSYERQTIATTINGGLFTFELITDGKINDSLTNALYAVVSRTQFTASETAVETAEVEEKKPTEVAAAEPEIKPEVEEKTTVTPEEKPVAEVAAATPTPKKPAEKKPAKKGNTKDILNELDALLN